MPDDVEITWASEAAEPQDESAVGIVVEARSCREVANRLVTIGDSLTHGFQSSAISKANLSRPALVASAMGHRP
jgi:hypothetical protein